MAISSIAAKCGIWRNTISPRSKTNMYLKIGPNYLSALQWRSHCFKRRSSTMIGIGALMIGINYHNTVIVVNPQGHSLSQIVIIPHANDIC